MSPYLYYDYMAYIERYTRLFTFYRPRVAVLSDSDGEVLMAVPLKGSLTLSHYRLLGDIQGCDRTDAIFRGDLTRQERVRLSQEFYSRFGAKAKLCRLQEGSPLVEALPEKRITFRQSMLYVHIAIEGDWEKHSLKLSKGVRQNIRTAFNRCLRDGKSLRLEVFGPDRPVDDMMWKKIMKLYFERLFSHYKKGKIRNPLEGLWRHFFYFRLKHDSLSLRRLKNSFHAVLLDEGKVVAFLSGMLTRDGGTLTVPRLAIDSGYSFYSPGYLLIAEVIDYLWKNTRVRELDMSRGAEKYKYDMGGAPYTAEDAYISRSL